MGTNTDNKPIEKRQPILLILNQMYKIFTALKCGNMTRCTLKFLLTMNLTIVLLFVTLLQVNAASYAQEVNLSVKNAPIQEVFNQLTKQTGYNSYAMPT
jgi:hypothetical protein